MNEQNEKIEQFMKQEDQKLKELCGRLTKVEEKSEIRGEKMKVDAENLLKDVRKTLKTHVF